MMKGRGEERGRGDGGAGSGNRCRSRSKGIETAAGRTPRWSMRSGRGGETRVGVGNVGEWTRRRLNVWSRRAPARHIRRNVPDARFRPLASVRDVEGSEHGGRDGGGGAEDGGEAGAEAGSGERVGRGEGSGRGRLWTGICRGWFRRRRVASPHRPHVLMNLAYFSPLLHLLLLPLPPLPRAQPDARSLLLSSSSNTPSGNPVSPHPAPRRGLATTVLPCDSHRLRTHRIRMHQDGRARAGTSQAETRETAARTASSLTSSSSQTPPTKRESFFSFLALVPSLAPA